MIQETYYDSMNRMGYVAKFHKIISEALIYSDSKFSSLYSDHFPFFKTSKFYKMINSNRSVFQKILSWSNDNLLWNLMIKAMSNKFRKEFLKDSFYLGSKKNLKIFYRVVRRHLPFFYSLLFEQLNPNYPLNKDLRKLVEK